MGKILLLTGRNEGYKRVTEKWLKGCGFPRWEALEMKPTKDTGAGSVDFKERILRKYKERYDVVGHVGDQLYGDCLAAVRAGVRPILVCPNGWLTSSDLKGGIEAV